MIRQVETEKIAIANSKEQSVFFGQRYILFSIAELFDPLLVNLMPPGSAAHNIAVSIDCFLPLSSTLSKRENCRLVADSLDSLSKQIKTLSGGEPELTNALRENIHCVMGVLDAMHSVLPIETSSWCDYCFRRTAINSVYCDVHKPSNDTEYRIGQRIYKTLPQEALDYRARYRAARRGVGESVTLISEVEDTGAALSSGPSINVSGQVAQLTKRTTSDWKAARIVWTQIIERHCPALLRIVGADMPSAHSSWGSWIAALKKVCQDEGEHTTNPYWILKNLGCAEDWFAAEEIGKDQRKTDTEEQIQKLREAGVNNVSAIARQLGVSRQYASRVINNLK